MSDYILNMMETYSVAVETDISVRIKLLDQQALKSPEASC